MLTETFMKESGSMTKLMVRELTLMPMGLTIKETGLMISKKDSEWSPGLMELSMRDGTKMGKSTAKENLHLLMEATMKESSLGMKSVEGANTTGLMGSSMMDNGLRIRCMVWGV
jgi:hypothetical protein